jgi:anti-anti-sigma factor
VKSGIGIPLVPVGVLRMGALRPLNRVPIGKGHLVAVAGRLDLDTIPGVRARLQRVSHHPGTPLDLDLSGVTCCDVLGLGLLVAVDRRARRYGGGLRLLSPSPAVVEALQVSGLARLLPVFPVLPFDSQPAAAA